MRAAILALPALMLASSCGLGEDKSADSTASTTRNFALSGFDKVSLRGSDNVSVITGKDFSIVATGPESELEMLEIEVDDGVLKIGRKSRSSWYIGWSRKMADDVRITVTMPSIRGASLAGSGDLTVDTAATDTFKASLAGSGDLKIRMLKAQSADLSLAGSGDIDVSGTVGTIEVSGAGSGDVTAGGLVAETAKVALAGSGNITARVTGSASVSVMGSGDVTIMGTDKCKTSRIGSGNISCKV